VALRNAAAQKAEENAAKDKSPPSQKVAEAAVKRHFEKTLRDPESARYSFDPWARGVITPFWSSPLLTGRGPATWKIGGVFVCGMVNSKNGFGGYAGRSPFAVRLTFDGIEWQVDKVLISDEWPLREERGDYDEKIKHECEWLPK